MATLPSASDPKLWGTKYNTYLQVEHKADGKHGDITCDSIKTKYPHIDATHPDYGVVADGTTDDASALRLAIAAGISTTHPVLLPAGSIKIGSEVEIASPVEIYGAGRAATALVGVAASGSVLSYTGTSNTPSTLSDLTISTTGYAMQCVNIASQSSSATPMVFKHCKFLGDLNGGGGFLFKTSGILTTIYDCDFTPSHADVVALNFEMNNQNSSVRNCRFLVGGKGISISNVGAGTACEGIMIKDNLFALPGTFAIEVGGSASYIYIHGNMIDQIVTGASGITVIAGAANTSIIGNYIGGKAANAGTGVYVSSAAGDNHLIQSNDIQIFGTGIVVDGVGAAFVDAVTINNNWFTAITNRCLELDSTTNCIVTSNTDTTAAPALGSWGTLSTVSSGSFTFDNNRWASAGLGSYDTSATYRYGNDTGIVGRNWGAATAGGAVTTLDIAHGCVITPSVVNVTMATTGASNVHVSAVDGTNITVTWTGAITATIYWEAIV